MFIPAGMLLELVGVVAEAEVPLVDEQPAPSRPIATINAVQAIARRPALRGRTNGVSLDIASAPRVWKSSGVIGITPA
jgi:hypothetical protein